MWYLTDACAMEAAQPPSASRGTGRMRACMLRQLRPAPINTACNQMARNHAPLLMSPRICIHTSDAPHDRMPCKQLSDRTLWWLQDKTLRTMVLSCLCQCTNSYLQRFAASQHRERLYSWVSRTAKPVLQSLRKGHFLMPDQQV